VGAYLADLYDYDRGLAKQFWNRANAGSARLYGRAAGLLGRGADLVGLKELGAALAQQRSGSMEEADQYDATAGAPRNTAEKVAAFGGTIAPDLLAYAAGGEVAGVGKAASFGANVLRGSLGALPITAALEADQEDGSSAQAIGRLLGSPKIEALSHSAAGRVAVGATLDLAGNVLGEGIAAGIKKWKGTPVQGPRITNELAPPPPVVPALEEATQGAVHPEADKPLWQVAVEARAETPRLTGPAPVPADRRLMRPSDYPERIGPTAAPNPEAVANRVTPPDANGPDVLAGTKVVGPDGKPKVVYHGTSATYEKTDPTRLDNGALYGPGLYHTEHPVVAGGEILQDGSRGKVVGYSQKGLTGRSIAELEEDLTRTIRARDNAAKTFQYPSTMEEYEKDIAMARANLKDAQTSAPQVRPARLAIKRPFDMDALLDDVDNHVSEDATHSALIDIGREKFPNFDWDYALEQLEQVAENRNIGGHDFYRAIEGIADEDGKVFGRARANQLLQEAGYDGITHIGGGRRGDKAHRVWIAFNPEQVRSPFHNGRAGFVNPTVAAHLAATGVGGTVGAQVGDTPEERQQNALIGAGIGLGTAAAGTVAARALTKAKPAPIAAMADPAVQAIRGMISDESKGSASATVKEILKGLHSQQINKLAPLNEFSAKVLGDNSLRHAAQNASGWIEAAGSRLRTDFTPVVKASEGIEDAVESLLAADRALELDRNGLSNKGFDLAAAQQTSALLSADPRVKQAADLYRDYYRNLLQRRADAGLITPDDYNRMVARGAYYVPFVRDAEYGGSNAGRGSRGLMQKGGGVRKMSDEMATSKIESPFRSAMKDTYQLERDISRQRVNDLIVKGWVTNPQVADDFVRQIPKGAKAPAGKVAETIRYQGQDMTFAVDQDFHKAWTSLAPDAQDIALGWMGKVKNLQRFGVTMAPAFTARNFTRDLVFTAAQQPFTRSHAIAGGIGAAAGAMAEPDHPVEGAVMGFSSGVVGLHALKVAKAFSEVVGKSKLYEEYLQAGGGGFGFWPRTQQGLDKVYHHLKEGTTAKDIVSPKSWLEGLEFVNHAIESAPRFAEAKRVAAAGGTMTEGANAGRNISVDFSLGGSSLTASVTDRTTPFFNAQKQALAKTLTVLKSPKAWAMGGVLITAPSIALWNINKDNPEYWKQPLWVRNTCWLVPKPDGDGFIKVVKPHEFGYLFGSLPERMMDWAYQNGKLGDTKERVPYSLGAGWGSSPAQPVPARCRGWSSRPSRWPRTTTSSGTGRWCRTPSPPCRTRCSTTIGRPRWAVASGPSRAPPR
jgi:hypothetical protein